MALGLVGQLISQLVRQQGGMVMGIDLRSERLDLAKRLGAEHECPADPTTHAAVQAITGGRGANCVIRAAASKSTAACQQALDIARERGRLVVAGAVNLSFPWNTRDGARATIACLRMLEAARTGKLCPIDLEAVLG